MPVAEKLSQEARAAKMREILSGMQVKLGEIESLRQEVHKERYAGVSASQAAQLLQEIKVPKIEILQESRKKK